MALNYVWIAFFVIGMAVALVKLIVFQDYEIFKRLVDGMFDSAKGSIMDIALPLTGVMVFFMGLLNVGEKAGAVNVIARLLSPIMRRLFPEVPREHPAMGQMVMNFSANMLGLDNAATPFGLKAMESLQELNPDKATATNAQVMFLVLHTSGLTLLPLTIFAYRAGAGSTDPTSVFIPCVLATIITTIISIIVTGLWQKLRFDGILIGSLAGVLALSIGLMIFIGYLPSQVEGEPQRFLTKENFSRVFGNFILFAIVTGFVLAGLIKKINVFDAFIEGAKGGWEVVVKIMPYLVGMLVAIRVFRESGSLEFITDAFKMFFSSLGIGNEFVPALPVAIMKPFSGSGARGLMLDLFDSHGPDSFVGQMASTFQGSADTTFYILALYFGSVGIKKVRHALWAGLITDFLGVIAAIIIAYQFFPH